MKWRCQPWLVKIIAIGLSVGHPTIAAFLCTLRTGQLWTTNPIPLCCKQYAVLACPILQPIPARVEAAGISRLTQRLLHVRVSTPGPQRVHGKRDRPSAEMSPTSAGWTTDNRLFLTRTTSTLSSVWHPVRKHRGKDESGARACLIPIRCRISWIGRLRSRAWQLRRFLPPLPRVSSSTPLQPRCTARTCCTFSDPASPLGRHSAHRKTRPC